MTLKELVKGKKVRFKFYRDGELWYETAEDGAIQYMRWIRKHLAARDEWERERQEQARNLPPGASA
jgi:hypothetical protein